LNHAVLLVDTIQDFEITEVGTELVIHQDLSNLFHDPDGDSLFYSLAYNESLLELSIHQHTLSVTANEAFSGDCRAELTASDGKSQATDIFYVTRDVTGISHRTHAGSSVTCYPNPFEDRLNIILGQDFSGVTSIAVDVYELSGSKVHSAYLVGFAAYSQVFVMDLSEQAAGTYLLRIRAGGINHSQMILKK
jgi:hypothetical protein